MANKLNGFLDNFFGGVTNPKGNLGDFQHAARLYVDDAFRLAPKNKFLFFVNFTLSIEAQRTVQVLSEKHMAELNMLAKTVDLPQYSANIDVKNQYNRKKVIQTSIEYTPVNLTLHDDNQGITSLLLEAYYRYYYRDSIVQNPEDAYDPRNTYQKTGRNYRYGLDNNRNRPFFDSIRIYQLSRHQFTEYTLVNPVIERWGHDSMDQSDDAGVTENTMVLNYEAVRYHRGTIDEDVPATFATTHYDRTPSPLQVQGGGVANLFGGGGVLDGGSSILGDVASGDVSLGTLLTAANTAKNARGLSREGLVGEGVSIFNRAVVNTGKQTVGGVPGTHFPKDGGPGSASKNTEALAPVEGSSNSASVTDKTRYAQSQAGVSAPDPSSTGANLWNTARTPANRGFIGPQPGGNTE